MERVWVNGRFLSTAPNKKAERWKPPPKPDPVYYATCVCGEIIWEGESVWMVADHERVVCLNCRAELGEFAHFDCAGLRFPDYTLEG